MIFLYDTKKRKIIELSPHKENTIYMYTCGPTVYNFAHIGNLRTFVFEDILRRSIQYFGMEVYQVMNFTDVDDKTIEGALREGKSLDAFTKVYKHAFLDDLKTLYIQGADKYTPATEHIPEMIEMIKTLIKKGYAYETPDKSIFFRIRKFPRYGELSHFNIKDLKEGASECIEGDEYEKENACDFVLWKAYNEKRDGKVYWDSPWGRGRPGWHIECSAMAIKYLGETFDLHVGGVDNIFPHHDNEIAQSEACTDKLFARHWVHAEHLLVEGKKMSKSLDNFYTLRDLLAKGYTGREVRYLLLSTHYRMQLNFTLEGLDGARNALRRIDDFLHRLSMISQDQGETLEEEVKEMKRAFDKAMIEDLHIAEALASLFTFIRKTNLLIDGNALSKKAYEHVKKVFTQLDQIIGCLIKEEEVFPQEVVDLAERRLLARKEKLWKESDDLRLKIESLGFMVEDTTSGYVLKKKV